MTLTRLIGALVAAALLAGPAAAATRPAARSRHVMVVASEPIAVEEGLKVLRAGGNAVDAAVTMAFVLAVTWPYAGNLGGGGYMLIRPAQGQAEVIDYREVAPAAATRGMFLDAEGRLRDQESLRSYRAVGVPGTVAGLALALQRHGTISFERALKPAARLAREGFTVSRGMEVSLARWKERLEAWPASRKVFLTGDRTWREGERLVQPDLARTLELLMRRGDREFYEGDLARRLAEDMKQHGGLITTADLAAYRPAVRQPLTGRYRSFSLLAPPPSSGGGVAVLQMLGMLEPHDLAGLGHNSSAYIHLVAEAARRAFADRSRWLGDPDFVKAPLDRLLGRSYALFRMAGFDPQRATPSDRLEGGDPLSIEGDSTTHFGVVDASGGIVSNTYTINQEYGLGAIATGLGYLLNNEMDDFTLLPAEPGHAGPDGRAPNEIAPAKRMLSSMTPLIVLRDEAGSAPRPWLVAGTPGGTTIPTTLLQVLLDLVEFGMEPQAAADAPRFHHQWKPDTLYLDKGLFPADVIEGLRRRGHAVEERGPRGDVQMILIDGEQGWLFGASDARGWGKAAGD